MRKIYKYSIYGFILAVILAVSFLVYEIFQLPRLPDDLTGIDLGVPTVIYAGDGQPIDRVLTRTVIPLSQISPYFTKAIQAIEDHRFYDHDGIDKIGLTRAIWRNIFARQRSGGGSTITQQLAKNLFFSFDRSYRRKLYDILLAMQFERRYTKDQILEAYCNQINFGNGAFGVENAALAYFGKHASELNLTEGAILASLPQRPTYFNPYIDETRVKSRFGSVLNRMKDLGWITESEYNGALSFTFTLKNLLSRGSTAPHFLEMVKLHVADKYGYDMLNYGGLQIYTTLDLNMQEKAAEAVEEGLMQLDSRLGKKDYRLVMNDERDEFPQAALIALENSSGAVRALVGGRDSQGDYYNRAVNARRSPGSAFKPIIYYTAINEFEIDGATVMVDSQVTYDVPGGVWTPRNFEREFQGRLSLKYAFMRSINTISAQLIYLTGTDKVVENAHKLGIADSLESVPSLALGSNGVSVLSLASAYGTFAAGGIYEKPYFITRIEDASGNILERQEVKVGTQAANPVNAYLVVDLMKGALEAGGTGHRVRTMGFNLPAGCKTGTTNDSRDAWFSGITPELAVTAWVGYDNFEPLLDPNGIGITGSTGALPIWTYFMKKIEYKLSGRDFPVPIGVSFKYINKITGEDTDEFDTDAIRVAVK